MMRDCTQINKRDRDTCIDRGAVEVWPAVPK